MKYLNHRVQSCMTLHAILPNRLKITLAFVLFALVVVLACSEKNPAAPEPGSGSDLFEVAKIARWDGSQWHSLGQGVTISSGYTLQPAIVNDIVIDEGLVYAGGRFEYANSNLVNSIATWSGSDWQGFGDINFPGVMQPGDLTRPAGTVNALVISQAVSFGKTLYVGGDFRHVVNDPTNALIANNIAMFYLTPTISTWDILRSGADGTVYAMDVNAAGLFVGGEFSSVDNGTGGSSDPVPNTNLIARWSIGSSLWAEVGGGIVGTAVYAITVDPASPNGSHVYVGGQFLQAGGVAVYNIARWAGNQWESLGSGLNVGPVYDIAIAGGNVYAAGQFWTTGSESFHLLARWDGNTWTLLGDEITPSGQAELYKLRGLTLAVDGNDIYLGGRYTTMDGQTVNHVAKLNGNSWQALTGGVHNLEDGNDDPIPSGVNAVAVSGSDVYVGGIFRAVGEGN